MKKQSFLSAILLLVFSLVILHDAIPHHHHDTIIDMTNHEHHHDDHKGHDHDKTDQDHSDHSDDHEGHFSHLSHVIVFTEFVFGYYIGYQKQETGDQKQDIDHQFLIKNFDIAIQSDFTIKKAPPNELFDIYLSPYYTTHLLRGPPYIIS